MKNIKVFFITKQAILILLFIVGSAYLLDAMWKYKLVQYERNQARSVLQKVASCTSGAKQGEWLDNLSFCASGVTTTPTGDIFAVNLKSKEFVFDPSVDCYVDGGKKMTADDECKLHQENGDPIACVEAIKIMSQGYDSYPGLDTTWNYDGSPEYLEWIIFPSESLGVGGVMRNGQQESEQILIAIGIQEDELFQSFKIFEMLLRIVAAIAFILVLLVNFQRKERQLNNA